MKHSLAMSAIIRKFGFRFSIVAVISRKINSSTSFSLKIRTALTGSPTYFGSLNLIVFTRPCSFSNRQGITLVRSMLQIHEVLQQLHSEFMAFLRMKLDTRDIALLIGGHEIESIMRPGQDIPLVRENDMIGMNKIKPCPFIHPPEQTVFLQHMHRVPSHVRDLPLIGRIIEAEPDCSRVHPSQARQCPFLAVFRHELHAETDPQDRNFFPEDLVAQDPHEPSRFEIPHSVIERSHSGQYDFVRRNDVFRSRCHHRVMVDLFQHVPDGSKISHPVIYDRKQREDLARKSTAAEPVVYSPWKTDTTESGTQHKGPNTIAKSTRC